MIELNENKYEFDTYKWTINGLIFFVIVNIICVLFL